MRVLQVLLVVALACACQGQRRPGSRANNDDDFTGIEDPVIPDGDDDSAFPGGSSPGASFPEESYPEGPNTGGPSGSGVFCNSRGTTTIVRTVNGVTTREVIQDQPNSRCNTGSNTPRIPNPPRGFPGSSIFETDPFFRDAFPSNGFPSNGFPGTLVGSPGTGGGSRCSSWGRSTRTVTINGVTTTTEVVEDPPNSRCN